MKMKNVEDIYPLSPMQQGILFHSVHDPVFAMYFEIITWTMHGEVSTAAFEQAWQRTVDRHPILRTAFVWEGLDEPLQVVRKRVKLPMARHDWRGLSAAGQEQRLQTFFEEERARGFDLTSAPLMRVALMQTSDDSYRFVWSYHHGLIDGWSGSLVFNDLFLFYEAASSGRELDVKPPRPFRDYIAWLQQQDLSKAEEFWRTTLKGFTAPTAFNVVGATPQGATVPDGARSYREQQLSLRADTTSALQGLARGHQLTLNTICQGAWAVLLSRYSGDAEVLFGVAVSGRPPSLAGVESMVGMLINTLPARVRVEGGAALLPWLREIQEHQVEMRQYEYSPLVQVHGWSDVPRGRQLFESIVSFENHPIDHSLLKQNRSAELRDVIHYHTATGYPLNVIIEPGDQLLVKILYDFGRFDDATVTRLMGHFAQLLESIARDPRQRLGELSMLPVAERRRLLEEWNDTRRDYPPDETLKRLWEAQAERTPDSVALVSGEKRVTYRELNEGANRVAGYLRKQGVGPEVPVALCAQRSVEMVVALLGILKAGGAYVPLDPAYPRERLAFMLEDTQAPVLLTQQALRDLVPAGGARVVCLDADQDLIAEAGAENPPDAGLGAQNLAYFIYTSGSTGRPKGVAITHHSAAVMLNWAREVFTPEETSGVLASTSVCFDLSVFELFVPLCSGGKVILAENALQLPGLAAVEEVTLVNTVPSAMAELLRADSLPASVRTVNLAGEPLPLRTAQQLYERPSVRQVFNLYGPSEDTTYSTFALVERGDTHAPNIGRPISNTRVYLLDEGMQPVPQGVPGEIFIGGEGLARGYFKRPALTAERFVPDPFGAEPGARLYRTGDLARYLPDGHLEFLGRLDHQVKVRGFRVEPGEIEAVLGGHREVSDCVVTAREEAPGDVRLVAYVVPSHQPPPPLRPALAGSELERLLSDRQHLKLPNGTVIVGHSSLQTSGIYREVFEEKIYLKHGIRINDGDCVFDVGANIGIFTLFVKQQCRNARVYAFEPLPPNFAVLRANAELYGLDAKLYECGLSQKSETAVFTFYPHAAAMSGYGSHVEADKVATKAVVQGWLQSVAVADTEDAPRYELDEFVDQYLQSETYTCALKTLSEVIRENGVERIDLLKLDVEKSELAVLNGIEERDWEKIQQLVIEVHTAELLERITRMLDERSFAFAVEESTIVDHARQDVVRVYMLYARRLVPLERPSNGNGRADDEALAIAANPEELARELRGFLREKLPEYMVPSAFVVLGELPLTPNGKVDRRALPAPGRDDAESEKDYQGPRTPVEEIVARICASVLGVERFGVEENFFEAGGHSLLAAQVISRVREAFHVELSLRNLFLRPTVAGLAENVESALRAGEGVAAPRITRAAREKAMPVSFAQQRLWFLDQLQPGGPFYNIPAAVRLEGELDLRALQDALDGVVKRHESLRTTFVAVDGRPAQIISPNASVPLPVEDLSHLPAAEREEAVGRASREEARHSFDLGRGPLLRARLVRLAAREHVLLLTMHHIISDGWSMGVMVRELGAFYAAARAGVEAALPELPVQYADFAAWQREWLRGEALGRQLSYWRERLEGAPPLLELPTDRPRPATQTYDGAVESFTVGAELSAQLKQLSQREGVTLFMTLLAAFDVLLHRYTGQGDIPVGTDSANRNRSEIEGLIGFFVNMLVLRADLSSDPSFVELLARVREVALEAYVHQDVPFEKLVEELQPERDRGHSPLFNVVFVLQNTPMELLRLPGLTLSALEFETEFTRFDLEFHLWERPDGLKGLLIYNEDLFDASTIKRLLGSYQTILESAVADPEQSISSLRVLRPAEERHLLEELNRTEAEYPRDLSVHKQFEGQARLSPDATALMFGDLRMTYDELNRRSNQLARYLRGLGVGPETPVAICVERSPEMVVGLLGILKAGGAYVPLDPDYPLKRLSYILEDVQSPILLTQERLAGALPTHWGQVIQLDADWELISREDEEDLPDVVSADGLIYVMYTSGSTGEPKGVSVTHRGVMRLVKGTTFARLDAGETLLQLAPLSFDASTFEIWGALLNGARLALMPPRAPSLEELGEALERYGVTTLWLTAGLFHLMVDERPEGLKGLRQLLAGGDVLSVPHVEKALRELKGCTLINGYGPTESTTFACCYTVPSTGLINAHTPIGRPIENTTVYVLDAYMNPAPYGVAGELYIGGHGLARGYLHAPSLTAERFIPDPFSREPGSRLYRTGDRARYLPDSNLEFLGRLDHQLKVRGFRVEPGEIEAALARHPEAREVAVVARPAPGGDRQLVAYIATGEVESGAEGEPRAAGERPRAGEWRAYLRERLPEHMVPSAFVVLDELPLTPNGKVDRRALPEPALEVAGAGEGEGEMTPVEGVVAAIWGEVLGVEGVGRGDDFFELGGHSLLATQVVSRMRGAFGVEVGLGALFEKSTVEGLAREVERGLRGEVGGGAATVAAPGEVKAVEREGAERLSFAQQRLWFLDQMEPGNPFYNIPTAVRLEGALDPEALREAFTRLSRRHESLRTTFVSSEGRPAQLIAGEPTVALATDDLSGLPEGEQAAEVARLGRAEAQGPFDLSRGPLWRARLVRLAAREHVLLLTMHHIISDGWSMGVMVRELGAFYAAARAGVEAALPELPVQYADFAAWQREWLRGEALGRQLSYWRERLEGAPPLLELPTDRPRPPALTYRGAAERFRVDGETVADLKALSQREGVTLFMTLLAAFDVLLHRYTGQGDIPVGTPIANRNRREVEGLIGFFVNTLVLRTRLDGAMSFGELLAGVRGVTLGAYAHQDVPFEKLVEELQPERDRSRNPLFQVMLALQNAPFEALDLPGLRLSGLDTETTSEKFDFTLTLAEADGGLLATWTYNTDLFDAATIRRMAGHFETLLKGVVADPARRISELPLLTERERRQLLSESSAPARYSPAHVCLHELFEAQAERTPDSVAVAFEGGQVSYAELNTTANRLAHRLRKMGVGPDVRVGILLERSTEMVAGMLGVLKAGGAYVPLDPDYPQAHLSYMLEDASIDALLTQRRLAGAIPTRQGLRVVCVDEPSGEETEASAENPARNATPDNLAYVIYTSGSTGRPKGVMISHRAICNHMLWMQESFPLTAEDRVLQKTPFSFDASVWEFYAPLLAGARLVVAKPGGHRDPSYLIDVIGEQKISVLQLVPTLLRALLDEPRLEDCTSLRRVFCGGEALSPELVEGFKKARLSAELHNLYGPTEATIDATHWECETGDERQTVPIGRPVANTQVYILDQDMNPAPYGVAGELYIGGHGLARGYLHAPSLTAERFIPDPFSREPGSRLYRTGDRARYLPDSNLEFLGRLDHQLKVRGFRVEPGEIEAALARHPEAREVAVVARPAPGGDRQLVAYIASVRGESRAAAGETPTQSPTQSPTAGEWRAYLRERLPEHMVPSAFVVLDELPLTPNGKVDRRALPELAAASAGVGGRGAEMTPVEGVVAAIWGEVLGVEGVGRGDDFFELGGHSLLATQVVSRMRAAFGVEVRLGALFEKSTVEGLAREVEAGLRGEGSGSDTSLVPPEVKAVEREGAERLSFAQQRLWFLDQLESAGAAYNIPAVFRVEGRLDIAALEETLSEIVRRHEALRTTFVATDGEPSQVISPPYRVKIPLTDLSGMPEAERDAEVERLTALEARTSFDLASGPLMRVGLLRLGEGKHVLTLTMHHIVADGWSMGVMVREVGALYKAYLAGEPSPLPELPVQYADFAAWQREWLRGEALERQLSYWRRQLGDSPPALELPTKGQRPAAQTFRGEQVPFALSESLTRELRALGRREGVTLFMTLLAAFDVLLHRYTGQGDIPVGTPIANRNRREVEGLIGFFVNTLVLRTRLDGAMSFGELLAGVRGVTLGAYAHQDVPFEKLVEELQPERDRSRNPLFQVMLILQNAPVGELELPGLTLRGLPLDNDSTRFDLECHLWEQADALSGFFVYNTDLFDGAFIRRMSGHFETLLEGIAADPARRISELPLLTGEEERRLLVEWNETAAEFPREMTLHEMFARQAASTPDAPAVVFEGERLSYGELERRANRLANYLRKCGVEADAVAAICVERSVEMIVGVLAVLKAGGAYLPIDPEYPQGRLAFMLEDAGGRVVITQSSLLERLPAFEGKVICLDGDWGEIESEEDVAPASMTTGDNLAYLIYTSGSTGEPKGVAMPHRPLVNLLAWQMARSSAPARTLQFASLSFDVSFQEIFSTLLSGSTLVLIRAEQRRDARELWRVLTDEQVERLFLPFVALQHLAEASEHEQVKPASLREVITAGEQLKITRHIRAMFERLGECELDNHYGPSECHAVSALRLAGTPPEWPELPSIGRPLPNVRLYVLDEYLRPVPVGVAGELYAGGECVSRGYLNRPAATAEKFIPDPFGGEPGARLYRTGDLSRLLPNGEIEFLGRADNQVKVRGFRVEPGEVESVLRQHAAVREAVVKMWETTPGEKRLAAYALTDESSAVTKAELRSYVRERLPEYMVPAAFVLLDEFPLTPSGKVNRRALPAPEQRADETSDPAAAPRTPTEEMLSGIWAEVLGVERVGTRDNFFDLGGHSLLAAQLMSRVGQAFQVEVPLRRLFEQPVLSGLARSIDEDVRSGKGVRPLPLKPAPRHTPLPLSFGQQSLWLVDQLEPDGVAYHFPAAVRLKGPLDVGALGRSLDEIVRRHEVLRTVFTTVEGQPVQIINPAAGLELKLIEVGGRPETEREEHVRRVIGVEVRERFDLSRGPLIRASCLRLADEEHVLLVVMHHIVCDGWSVDVFVRELVTLYEAFTKGLPSPLPELEFQYADYACWQREWLQGEALENLLTYWRQRLAGAPPLLELPADRPRPPAQSFRGGRLTFALPQDLGRMLGALSRGEGVTTFMTLLAAFQTLLHRYTGQEDIVIGADINGRNRVETEKMIGYFINMLVMRSDLSGNPTFRGLLKRVRSAALGAYAHQDLPFEKIVEELQPERSMGHSPIFQVVFNFDGSPPQSLEMPDLTLSQQPLELEQVKFDLSLFMWDRGGELTGAWMYSADLFDAERIARMHRHFEALLRSIVERPDTRLDALELLTEAEKEERSAAKSEIKKTNLQRFKSVSRKAVTRSHETLVETGQLTPGGNLPLVVRPAAEDVDLAAWAASNREFIETLLLKHGGLLFRNFNVTSLPDFRRFTEGLSPELLDYSEPSSPRTEVGDKIYTSTEYPPDQWIQLHNEMSYAHHWPRRVYFFCERPAESGGETPIAYSRKVYELLDPRIREAFIRRRVMYVRNYGEGLGLPWQHVFGTSDRATVEQYCRRANVDFEWKDGGRLKTRQVRQSVIVHPSTGEAVWFNQAHAFHASALDAGVRESLRAEMPEEEFPRNAYYGDGSPIEDSVIEEIRAAYAEAAVAFPWQARDILMLENMLVAHGRKPYAGPRRVLVAMSGVVSNEDVDTAAGRPA